MSERTPTGKIITFYSYKGGTGRSMALANIAWILASARQRVLVLDWDLEAPGLHRYFRPFLIDKELTSSPGIIDYIIDFCDEAIKPLAKGETLPSDWYVAHADIRRYRISIDYEYFPDGGKIDFVPAGQQGTTYATRVNSFNWQDFYQRLGGGAFLDATRERMREKYDYILIDSRTGVSDTAGICTVQMPDVLAVFFTFNNQSIEGAAAVAQSVYDQRGKERQRGRHKFQILAVPTRVDQTEQKKLKQRKVYAHWRFNPLLEQIPLAERRSYWGTVEVPYVPYYAYEEVLAPFNDEIDDPKSVLASMNRITDFLVRPEIPALKFATLLSPQDQQRILQEFAATPAPASEEGQPLAGTAEDQSGPPVESALDKQLRLAEASLIGLDQQEHDEARRLWTRLVRVPRLGEKAENSKVRVNLSEFDLKAHPLVEKLAELELLLFGKDELTGQETIEVSNEELLRSWPLLREWIDQDRLLFLWRQDLQTRKVRWEESGRKSIELMRGRELAEAKRWYKTHRAYLSDGESAFIVASIQRQRLAIAIPVITLLSVLLVSYNIYYFAKKSNTKNIADNIATQAQQLIDASNTGSQQADQFQLGILLATEAERLSPSVKTEEILRLNLPKLPRRVSTTVQTNNVLRVAMSATGSQVLAVTGRPRGIQPMAEDRSAQLQEATTGKVIARVPFRPGTRTFELSSDGKYLATVSAEKKTNTFTINLLDVANSRTAATILHKGAVLDMVFSPDGLYFACASEDATTQVVALSDPNMRQQVLRQEGTVNSIAFSGDSKFIATAGEDFMVHIWAITPDTGKVVPLNEIKLTGTAFNLALSPAGNYLATISLDNQVVRVWDVANRKFISPLTHDYGINSLVFSPDSQFIITAGNGGNIKVWDRSGKIITSLRFEGDAEKVFFSPLGKYLAAIGNSKVARVWSYHDSQFNEVAALIQGGNFNDLAFGGDATNLVATAGADNTIRVWDLGTALTQDLQQSEPCARLTRNLTIEEWDRYLSGYLGAYRRTCPDIP